LYHVTSFPNRGDRVEVIETFKWGSVNDRYWSNILPVMSFMYTLCYTLDWKGERVIRKKN